MIIFFEWFCNPVIISLFIVDRQNEVFPIKPHFIPLSFLVHHFRVRIFVHGIVTIPCFDTFIMIIIILSSIALAAEDPVQEQSQRNIVLTYFDYVFTGIFAIEMFLKVRHCFDC